MSRAIRDTRMNILGMDRYKALFDSEPLPNVDFGKFMDEDLKIRKKMLFHQNKLKKLASKKKKLWDEFPFNES